MKRKAHLSSDSSPSSSELYNDAADAIDKALKRLKIDHCCKCETIFNSDIICVEQVDYLTYVRYSDFRGIIQEGTSLDYQSVDEAKYQWNLLKKLNKMYVLQPERLFQKFKKKREDKDKHTFCLLFPGRFKTIRWWLKKEVANEEIPIITHIFRGVMKCMKYIHESDDLPWSDSWDTLCIDKSTNEVYLLNLSKCSKIKNQDQRMLASLYSLMKNIFKKKSDAANDLYMTSFYKFMKTVRLIRRIRKGCNRDVRDIYLWLYNHPIIWNVERSLTFISTVNHFYEPENLKFNNNFVDELRKMGHWMKIGAQNPIMQRTIANSKLRCSDYFPEDIALFAHICVQHYWENAYLPEKRKLRSKDAFDALLQMCPKLLMYFYTGMFRASYSISYVRSLKIKEFSTKVLLEERIAS